ncbi:MAG: hypothetical protein AAF478_03655 [Pseudomonadota bacterium]
MKRFVFAGIFLGLVSTAHAACPPAPDIIADETRLFAIAQAADNRSEGQKINRELWQLWAMAPDEQAQALLDRGMTARSSFDFLAAIDAFDRLTKYCPNYAEGYNQRAFVNFLREDYNRALIDLNLALELNPRHVAALSGKALTLIRLGRNTEAQIVLREAVSLNPWIPERGLIVKPKGTDL